MIHPSTTLKAVSEKIGSGVFATEFLPQGTFIVVRDAWDHTFSEEEFALLPAAIRDSMENYAYHDKDGLLVVSWDHAKYMNHNCHSNSKMTAYGVEIVVRDIAAGEEITTEYGLLNVQEPYALSCNCEGCRRHLALDDIDRFADEWDREILESLRLSLTVEQPLQELFGQEKRQHLERVGRGEEEYLSTLSLKWLRGKISN